MSGGGSNITINYAAVSTRGPNNRIETDGVRIGISMVGTKGGTFSNLTGIQQISSSNDVQPNHQQDFIRLVQQLLDKRDITQLTFLSDNNKKEVLEAMISGARPNDLLTFKQLINSIALVRNPNYHCGTMFIAKLEGLGVCFLSAGHIFQSILHERNTQITFNQLQNFLASFGDIDGIIPYSSSTESLEKGKPMNLKLLFDTFAVCGSVRFGGKRKAFNRSKDKWITDFKNDLQKSSDYFAMLLSPEIENHLDDLGLEVLRVASGSSLKHQPKNVVTIIGHPGHEDWETYPRRISYGLEKEVPNGLTKIASTYDSLPGNSGSPVFGENYQVKGIHVSGGASANYMQSLEHIEEWIEIGRNLSN